MDDNVVRLCVNGRKIEQGMNAQLYTLRDVTRLPTGGWTKFLRTTAGLSSHFRFGRAAGTPGNRRGHHPCEHGIRLSTPVLFLVFTDRPLASSLCFRAFVTEFDGS